MKNALGKQCVFPEVLGLNTMLPYLKSFSWAIEVRTGGYQSNCSIWKLLINLDFGSTFHSYPYSPVTPSFTVAALYYLLDRSLPVHFSPNHLFSRLPGTCCCFLPCSFAPRLVSSFTFWVYSFPMPVITGLLRRTEVNTLPQCATFWNVHIQR